MSKGSYRGGSSTIGWNANQYVAPSLTGRTRKGKALIGDLTARTAQSRAAAAAQDARIRKLHGLAPPRGKPVVVKPSVSPSTGKSGLAEVVRKRRKAAGRQAFTVTVVRRRKQKG